MSQLEKHVVVSHDFVMSIFPEIRRAPKSMNSRKIGKHRRGTLFVRQFGGRRREDGNWEIDIKLEPGGSCWAMIAGQRFQRYPLIDFGKLIRKIQKAAIT